eukprot:6198084-Pleurochrysis_carterae.AAC.10
MSALLLTLLLLHAHHAHSGNHHTTETFISMRGEPVHERWYPLKKGCVEVYVLWRLGRASVTLPRCTYLFQHSAAALRV